MPILPANDQDNVLTKSTLVSRWGEYALSKVDQDVSGLRRPDPAR